MKIFPHNTPLADKPDYSANMERIRSLPKVELHLHLEGILNEFALFSLMKKNRMRVPGVTRPGDLKDRFRIRNLRDFLRLFLQVILPSLKKEEDLLILVNNARDYCLRNNIVYAELYFSPAKLMLQGMSYAKMLAILDESIERIEEEGGPRLRLLIDVSRGYGVENGMRIARLTRENRKKSILGISLGGSDRIQRGRDFKFVFAYARGQGMHTVAHAGEDTGPQSIWDALNILKAERIGHATSAIRDRRLMDYLKQSQIPLEICLSSNVRTGKYVHSFANHPVHQFYQRNLLLSINSDDPGIFSSELNEEYAKLYKYLPFSYKDMLALLKMGVHSSFLAKAEKDELLRRIDLSSQ